MRGVGDRLLWGGPRRVRPGSGGGASDCPYSRHGPTRLDTSCGPIDPPAEPNTPIWPNLVNRPGLDLYTGPCEKPAGADHRSFVLGRRPGGVWMRRGCMHKRCREKKKDDATILPRGVLEPGARIR